MALMQSKCKSTKPTKSTWQFWQQLWNLSLHCEEFFKRQSFGSQHGSRRLHCWNELRHESSGNPTANLTNAVSGITPPEALDSCITCAQIRGHSVDLYPFLHLWFDTIHLQRADGVGGTTPLQWQEKHSTVKGAWLTQRSFSSQKRFCTGSSHWIWGFDFKTTVCVSKGLQLWDRLPYPGVGER